MYNFNSQKRKRRIAIVGIVLATALLITTIVSALII